MKSSFLNLVYTREKGFAVLILVFLLSGCTAPVFMPSPTPTLAPSPTSEPSPTSTLTPSNTPAPSITSTPTLTPFPTIIVSASTPTPYRSPTVTFTPGPPRAGMQMVFDDEFNGFALDTSRWNTCYPWDNQGCTNAGNHELEWYLPDEALVENGLLRLRARQNPVKGSDGNSYPYTSGMVSSHDKFSLTYGYIEMRARMPGGRGFWPAFWLLPQTREWPPEIDVLEVLGHDPFTLYTTLHYKTEGSPHLSHGHSTYTPFDLSQGFHTYAIDWQKDLVVWYFDGVEVFRVMADVPAQPMYLIANLAVGGDWPGSPNEKTLFPGYFEIDYIRVYTDKVK